MTQTKTQRVPPMLASSSAPFDDPGWLFDVKWDGVRAMTLVSVDGIHIWGRDRQDYTDRYPHLQCLRRLPPGTILDGELVLVLDGRPDFHALMARHRARPNPRSQHAERVQYVVFDVLSAGEESLLKTPVEDRREQLLDLIGNDDPAVTCCLGVRGGGKRFFEKAVAAGHEGVVAKQLGSHYRPGARTTAWKKIKPKMEVPCVLIGYRPDVNGIRDLLLAGVRDRELRFVGAIELGIPNSRGFAKQLESLRQSMPTVPCSVRGFWIKPELVCMIRFSGYRPNGAWRDPVFAGWVDSQRV